jgi:hypothetical protein
MQRQYELDQVAHGGLLAAEGLGAVKRGSVR